jgi:hypothetical protein
VERPGRIDDVLEILDQEATALAQLAPPPTGHCEGICDVGKQKSGVDEIGRATGERIGGDVVRLEAGAGEPGSGRFDKRSRRVDSDERPGMEELIQELRAEAGPAPQVEAI